MGRPIKVITKELAECERALRDLYRAVGDDLGCDGSGQRAEFMRGTIDSLKAELREARFEQALVKLRAAERDGVKAQAARDRAEVRFDKAMAAIRAQFPDEWKAECERTGTVENYNFGDVIC